MLPSILRPMHFLRLLHLAWALPLLAFSIESLARANDITNWSDQDFALYPQFCRARIERQPQELVDFWTQRIGPKNYIHIHHFCFGLKALNLAYASLSDKQSRAFLANAVVGNFNYIIEHTERTFYMRPEAYVNLGRGHLLRQEYDVARQKFHEALKLNPKLVDAWVAMSDMYHQLGKKSDALAILEQASEICGENKKIDLRIAEMRSAGIKSSSADLVPVQKPAPEPVAPSEAAPASEPAVATDAVVEQAPEAAPASEAPPAK